MKAILGSAIALRLSALAGVLVALGFALALWAGRAPDPEAIGQTARGAQRARSLDLAERLAARAIAQQREQLALGTEVLARDPVYVRAISSRYSEAARGLLVAAARRVGAERAWFAGMDGTPLVDARLGEAAATPLPADLLREVAAAGRASRVLANGPDFDVVAVAATTAASTLPGQGGALGLTVFTASLGARLKADLAVLPTVSVALLPEPPAAPAAANEKRLFLPGVDGAHITAVLTTPARPVAAPRPLVPPSVASFGAAMVAVSVLIAFLVARRAMQPVSGVHEAVKRVGGGDFEPIALPAGRGELAQLVESFNITLESLRQREQRMLKLAYRDALTALPNRTLFRERLEHAVQAARGLGRQVSVLLMDLDDFKRVNESLGHHAGDAMLREVAERTRTLLRVADSVMRVEASGEGETPATFARLGSDEFAVVLPGCDAERASRVAARLIEMLRKPFRFDGQMIELAASAGVASFPEHGNDAASVAQCAEIAMREAKRRHCAVFVHDPAVERDRAAQVALLAELRRALEQGELRLMFQPKVSLRGEAKVMAEALLRWEHPERGPQDPMSFVPLAERVGFVVELTRWVLEHTMRQAGVWRREGIDVNVAVNVSARDIAGQDFAAFVVEQLRRHELEAATLTLEVTEGAAIDDLAAARENLQVLARLGVRLAIDDFGTGFASLSKLRELPFDSMKIDRSFVQAMSRDPGSRVIVRSTVELGHGLGLSVIAEGVEDAAALDLLRNMGCDYAQGFYFGKPLHAEDFPSWIRHQSRRFIAATAARSLGDLPVGI